MNIQWGCPRGVWLRILYIKGGIHNMLGLESPLNGFFVWSTFVEKILLFPPSPVFVFFILHVFPSFFLSVCLSVCLCLCLSVSVCLSFSSPHELSIVYYIHCKWTRLLKEVDPGTVYAFGLLKTIVSLFILERDNKQCRFCLLLPLWVSQGRARARACVWVWACLSPPLCTDQTPRELGGQHSCLSYPLWMHQPVKKERRLDVLFPWVIIGADIYGRKNLGFC